MKSTESSKCLDWTTNSGIDCNNVSWGWAPSVLILLRGFYHRVPMIHSVLYCSIRTSHHRLSATLLSFTPPAMMRD
jgi:hypothetical protein